MYSALLLAALVAGSPWWLWQMATRGRYRAGLPERLGRVPSRLGEVRRQRDSCAGLLWLHAVSVGEVLAAETLVTQWAAEMPGWQLVVSTTTLTGQQVARERLRVPVFYFPLDFAFAIRPYLRALRPTLVVSMESELWPRMLVECERAHVPFAVVNARISDRSFPRYLRLRKVWKPLLAKVALFCAQSRQSADRIIAIGAPEDRVRVSGNLKHDAVQPPANDMIERVEPLLGSAKLIVAGSTLPGEEAILLEHWPEVLRQQPDTLLLIAPRHPQRFDEVFSLIRGSHLPCLRCRELSALTQLPGPGTILLLDTLGDLAAMYSIANVAFIGGSLVPKGGHNPLEATRFNIPVLMGSSFENFREMVDPMIAKGQVEIVSPALLGRALLNALSTPRGTSTIRSVESQATSNTVLALKQLLRTGERGAA